MRRCVSRSRVCGTRSLPACGSEGLTVPQIAYINSQVSARRDDGSEGPPPSRVTDPHPPTTHERFLQGSRISDVLGSARLSTARSARSRVSLGTGVSMGSRATGVSRRSTKLPGCGAQLLEPALTGWCAQRGGGCGEHCRVNE